MYLGLVSCSWQLRVIYYVSVHLLMMLVSIHVLRITEIPTRNPNLYFIIAAVLHDSHPVICQSAIHTPLLCSEKVLSRCNLQLNTLEVCNIVKYNNIMKRISAIWSLLFIQLFVVTVRAVVDLWRNPVASTLQVSWKYLPDILMYAMWIVLCCYMYHTNL